MVTSVKTKTPRVIKASEYAYRMLLYLLPRDYREYFGQDTILDFRQKSLEVYETHGIMTIQFIWLWVVVFCDLLNSVIPETIRVVHEWLWSNSNNYNFSNNFARIIISSISIFVIIRTIDIGIIILTIGIIIIIGCSIIAGMSKVKRY